MAQIMTQIVLSQYLLEALLFPPGISSVQSLSCVRLFVIPWTAALLASLSITSSPGDTKLSKRAPQGRLAG